MFSFSEEAAEVTQAKAICPKSASSGKESAYNAESPGFDPWVGKIPGEGNGYVLQYSCVENPMDRGPWQATVHGVAKSWTQLSDSHFLSQCQQGW